MLNTVTITAAEVAAAERNNPHRGRYVCADTNAMFAVVGQTADGPIVRGTRTNVLGRVVRTGRKVNRANNVRVRIEFARDLNDVIGTLDFGGDRVGGYVNEDVVADL